MLFSLYSMVPLDLTFQHLHQQAENQGKNSALLVSLAINYSIQFNLILYPMEPHCFKLLECHCYVCMVYNYLQLKQVPQ